MTIKEMQYRFGIKVNQLDSALQLYTDDIEYWLNRAQLAIVKEAYENFTTDKRIYEQNPERVDDFRVLITRNTSLDTGYSSAAITPTGYFVDTVELPSNYMFLLASKSVVHYNYPSISFTVANNKRSSAEFEERIVVNEVVQPDDIYDILSDPFNTTKIKRPLCTINDDNIMAYTDGKFLVDKVIIDYLKEPTPMNIESGTDSELPNHLHDNILDVAVNLFASSVRSQQPAKEVG